MFLSRTTKLNGEIFLKRYGTSLTREKNTSFNSNSSWPFSLGNVYTLHAYSMQSIRITGPCKSSSHCRGTSTDVEGNLNGALCKEWCKEDLCPTSCCCLVLPSSISVARDLSGNFPDPFACLQWAQAPALAQWRIKDSKTLLFGGLVG